ncbi:MAG: catalase [Candidatus Firestonebacteria bacterium RIFOXYA2_FULL_40_8]|nr:MAG: catalase [Candidatus Firestonebacteria bacterium RIFOXYA2_FULL_40_8]
MSDKNIFTTNTGVPVDNDLNSVTAGSKGPTLVQDIHLIEKLAHFDRERIPDRVVHAKGAGAHGYFEVTHDVKKYTRAEFLSEVGKRTEVLVRFSLVSGEKGSADSERDPRGFSVKFYTEEGNYDFVGNNTPVFFIRDAMKFPDFIHSQKRNPSNNLKDADMFWDFLSLTPESIHQVTILFSDRGTPSGYRNIHGFSGHTFMWYNEKGDYCWVKTHIKTEQGIKNLTRDEAVALAGKDPDQATRDLYENIKQGNFPAWTVYIQVMTPSEAKSYRFDPFDITKVWPHADYPLQPIGRMVLNRNPENFFAEVEQAAFSPGNFVPGIGASPDRLLQGRLFSYHDTQRHRLGPNFQMLPSNMPKAAKENSYQRDGAMRFDKNGSGPNYWPNTFGGPAPDSSYTVPAIDISGMAARHAYELSDVDFVQADALYSKVMTDMDREHLIGNIVSHLNGAQKRIQLRQTALFYKVNAGYGERVAKGLELNLDDVKRLTSMSQEERVKATSGESKL